MTSIKCCAVLLLYSLLLLPASQAQDAADEATPEMASGVPDSEPTIHERRRLPAPADPGKPPHSATPPPIEISGLTPEQCEAFPSNLSKYRTYQQEKMLWNLRKITSIGDYYGLDACEAAEKSPEATPQQSFADAAACRRGLNALYAAECGGYPGDPDCTEAERNTKLATYLEEQAARFKEELAARKEEQFDLSLCGRSTTAKAAKVGRRRGADPPETGLETDGFSKAARAVSERKGGTAAVRLARDERDRGAGAGPSGRRATKDPGSRAQGEAGVTTKGKGTPRALIAHARRPDEEPSTAGGADEKWRRGSSSSRGEAPASARQPGDGTALLEKALGFLSRSWESSPRPPAAPVLSASAASAVGPACPVAIGVLQRKLNDDSRSLNKEGPALQRAVDTIDRRLKAHEKEVGLFNKECAGKKIGSPEHTALKCPERRVKLVGQAAELVKEKAAGQPKFDRLRQLKQAVEAAKKALAEEKEKCALKALSITGPSGPITAGGPVVTFSAEPTPPEADIKIQWSVSPATLGSFSPKVGVKTSFKPGKKPGKGTVTARDLLSKVKPATASIVISKKTYTDCVLIQRMPKNKKCVYECKDEAGHAVIIHVPMDATGRCKQFQIRIDVE